MEGLYALRGDTGASTETNHRLHQARGQFLCFSSHNLSTRGRSLHSSLYPGSWCVVSAILALLTFRSLAGGVVGFLSSGKGIATLCVRRAQDMGCRDLVTQIYVREPLVYSRLQSW